MKKLIRNLLICLPSLLIIGMSVPVSVSAACAGDNTAKGQVLQGVGSTGSDCTGSGVTSLAGSIVNILSLVLGIVAVIMVLVGGFRFITSGGDSGNVKTARSTIIYALIGLVVAVAAQFLVHFVINSTNKAVSSDSSNCKVVVSGSGPPSCPPTKKQ